jgi:hypothetical protein
MTFWFFFSFLLNILLHVGRVYDRPFWSFGYDCIGTVDFDGGLLVSLNAFWVWGICFQGMGVDG